jgi:hypothetical protein
MYKSLAPIVLFAYNRPRHLQQTLKSLQNNSLASQSILYAFSDAPKSEEDAKNVEEVRDILHKLQGFKEMHITERKENWGLARSIIEGVSEVMQKYQKVIVLEDDLLLAPNFLDFMNDCLLQYEKQSHIFSVSGYLPPIQVNDIEQDVFLLPRCASWGWASWHDRWAKADWQVSDFANFLKDKKSRKAFEQGGNDMAVMLLKQQIGEIESWAIRWTYTHFKQNAFAIYPKYSKVKNIGMDGTGTNFHANNTTTKYDTSLTQHLYHLPKELNWQPKMPVVERFKKFYNLSYYRKIINFFKYRIW